MYLDRLNCFFDNQSIATAAATSAVVDLGAQGIKATYVPLVAQITKTAVGTGSVTLTFESSEDKAFGSANELLNVQIPAAQLIAGYQFPLRVVPLTKYRYMRVQLASATISAGSIYVGVAVDLQDN